MTTHHPIPDAALVSHLAILGRTGAGKSYAARGVVERLLQRGERTCIVDPTGVWYGLRLSADGRSPSGLAVVILGGPHADVPLDAGAGLAVARLVGKTSTPVVLDVLALGTAARTRFFTDFAEALLAENSGPLHLVLDEAHLFAPQTRVPDPQSALMVHATNNLVSLGRARGIGVMLLTQRPAKLHKDSLTQVAAMVALQLTAPQDRKAVEAWIGDQADKKRGVEIIASLPSLKRGEGWVWAPEQDVLERVSFPRIATFDSMRAPEAGASAPVLPPIDVAAVAAALVTSETTPFTSGSTRKRHAEPISSAADLVAAERRGFERGFQEGTTEGLRRALEALESIKTAVIHATDTLRQGSAPIMPADLPRVDARPMPCDRTAARSQTEGGHTPPVRQKADLNSAGRKMLGVLDTSPPVRRSWQQVATLAGLRARGGHFNAGKKGLIDAGLVILDGALVVIATPSKGAAPPRHDPAALVATWCAVLSGVAPRILRALFESSAPGWTKAEIADALGVQPRGGHWNAGWKELRENGLVVIEGERVRLASLFTSHVGEVEPA